MPRSLADFRVLGIVERSEFASCYRVEEKSTGCLFVWEAVDCGLLSPDSKATLLDELKILQDLNLPHIISYIGEIEHTATETLYLIKEYCGGSVSALITKCRSTNSFVDEAFVWRILYQVARAVQGRYCKGTPSILLDLTAAGVNLDDEGNVKLNFRINFRSEDPSEDGNFTGTDIDVKKKKADTYAIGCVAYELTSLQRFQKPLKHPKIPNQYSEDLQKLIKIMLSDIDNRPTIEGILYHPALVSNVVVNSLQKVKIASSDTSSTKSDGSSDISVRQKDLQDRLTAVRKREANIRSKECEFKEREHALAQKEKQVALLERLAKEKMQRAEIYLSQNRRNRCGISVKSDDPPDLDSSSYSADTGETSFIPTTAKIDPSRILRPPSLAPSVLSRRSVRFETIPEFDEPKKNMDNEPRTWLNNKRVQYRERRSKGRTSSEEKENRPPSEVGHGLVRNKKKKGGSIASLVTKETRQGLLETFFK